MRVLSFGSLEGIIKNNNWGVVIKSLKRLPYLMGGIYILPEENSECSFLGNKIVHYGDWISIRTISKEEFFKQYKIAKSCTSEKSMLADEEIINNFKLEESKSLSEKSMHIIDKFFTSDFIDRNELYDKLKDIEESKEEIELRDASKFFRFEQEFDTYKVILSYSLVREGFEIVLERNNKKLSNPIMDFFEYEFEYEQYYNAIKKHELIFLELQGEPMYPEASYNDQFFKVVFNVYDVEGSEMDIYRRSSWNQARFTKKLIKFLSLIFGSDINYKDMDSLGLERGESIYNIDQNKNNCFAGVRYFQFGLFTIDLNYGIYHADDEEEKVYEVAGIEVNIKPYKRAAVSKNGWYYHPMVYEWGK